MVSLFLPIFLVTLSTRSFCEKIYVKAFPAGQSFKGKETGIDYALTGDPVACAGYFSDSKAIVAFVIKNNFCTGYSEMHGLKDANPNETSYLMVRSDQDVCSAGIEKDFNEMVKCAEGFITAKLGSKTICYDIIEHKYFKDYSPITKACERDQWGHAASIRNREEEDFIVHNLTKWHSQNTGFQGVKVGLVVSDQAKITTTKEGWAWADGTPMDYASFDFDELKTHCSKPNSCTHGGIYWPIGKPDKRYWGAGEPNTFNLLCERRIKMFD